MNELMLFEGQEVEIIELNGQALFNPKHVAECLGIADVNSSIRNFNEKQVVKLKNSDMHNLHIRKLNNAGEKFLTECGVYKLAFRSHKENAEKFTDWIADEVLPSIRKTGSYTYKQAQRPQYPGFPSKHPWLIEMEDNFKFLCNAYEFDRRKLYHKILEDINKTYTVDDYKVIYKYQNGHTAEYVMEVVAFFPELREEAEKTILFHIEKKKNIKQEICTMLKENNVSQAEIARNLGYSATIFYDKMKMFSFKVEESKKIARLLGCEQMAM